MGAGLGGIAGSWMKGCEGWTWVDDEPGMAVDTEEGLLRSWAETQGCTAPGRSTEVGRGDSLLVPVLLELLVLVLRERERGSVRRLDEIHTDKSTEPAELLKQSIKPKHLHTFPMQAD